MNKAALTFLTLIAISIITTGCNKAKYSNAKILSEDESKIVLTVNKDLSSTILNANTGERIEPCVTDLSEKEMNREEIIKKCYPEGHNPNGKILSKSTMVVTEGSICATITVGSRLYVICQPPHNLGF
ncbi:MAG: hypothetical protein JAZ19_19160 [Candidatus Thiodiazotropha taylori]|nr:hypothetical protein [Candidatus Thiodiazotropha taylori]